MENSIHFPERCTNPAVIIEIFRAGYGNHSFEKRNRDLQRRGTYFSLMDETLLYAILLVGVAFRVVFVIYIVHLY